MKNERKIKIFFLEHGIEKWTEATVFTSFDDLHFKYSDSYELFNEGYTACCKFCGCLDNPDELPSTVKFAYEDIPLVHINPDETTLEEKQKIWESDAYKLWHELWIKSEIVKATHSMFHDSYKYLIKACKHNGNEDLDDGLVDDDWKDPLWTSYLFNEIVGWYNTNLSYNGCWILEDGSIIYVDTANHRRLIEEYLGLSEYNMERKWVKISINRVYTHKNMTREQWVVLRALTEKYPDLSQREIET